MGRAELQCKGGVRADNGDDNGDGNDDNGNALRRHKRIGGCPGAP